MNTEAIEKIGKMLMNEQRFLYRLKGRDELLRRPATPTPFENGKIDAYRNCLFALGLDQATIDKIQWTFEN